MRPATVRQCVVLADGENSGTPPFLRDCGGRPALAWMLRELVRFGVEECVLLAGPRAGEVPERAEAIARALPRPLRLICAEAPAGAGSGGALRSAGALLEARFLLADANAPFDANLAALLADAAGDGADVAAHLARPSGTILGVFDRGILQALAPACSLEGDVLPALTACGRLAASGLEGEFFDLRTPSGFVRAEAGLSARLLRPALLLDRDGVLNVDLGFVGGRERFVWMRGALEAARMATAAGWHVLVASNQSGVGRGFYDEAAVEDLFRFMAESCRAAGGTLDDWRYCPYHPEAPLARYRRDSDRRKPAPGMLLDLLSAWEVAPGRAVMIGDAETDMAAAAAAGVRGVRFPGNGPADLSAAVARVIRETPCR